MALLSSLLAIVSLGLAADPPQLAGMQPLAASALFGAFAMAALSLAGAMLQRPAASRTLGLGRGALGPSRIAALAIGTIGLSQLLNTLLVETGLHERSVLREIEQFVATAGGGDYFVLLVALAIAPGIAEELLFRGLVLRSVAGAWGSAAALLASSLLFGLAHFDLAQGGAAALLGLFLGAVALKGDSIRACVVCHIANNVAAVTWVSVSAANGNAGDPNESWLIQSAAVAASAIGLVALATPSAHGDTRFGTPHATDAHLSADQTDRAGKTGKSSEDSEKEVEADR